MKVRAIDGESVGPNIWVVGVSPVLLDDGRELQWHPPVPVAFSLHEAKRLCERAVPERRRILGNLQKRENGTFQPTNGTKALDVIAALWSAVLHAAAAIEAMANESIEQLPEDAVVTIGRKGRTEEVAKADMARRLNLDEKLTLVVPMTSGGVSIKGTYPWEQYRRVIGLRGDLVHVKGRGVHEDPEVRTAYDRLLLGEGDICSRDALDVVQAMRPGFLPDHVVESLTR